MNGDSMEIVSDDDVLDLAARDCIKDECVGYGDFLERVKMGLGSFDIFAVFPSIILKRKYLA